MFLCVFKHFQPYALWILYTDTITKACTDNNENLRMIRYTYSEKQPIGTLSQINMYTVLSGLFWNTSTEIVLESCMTVKRDFCLTYSKFIKKKKIIKWKAFQESDWMLWLAHCNSSHCVQFFRQYNATQNLYSVLLWIHTWRRWTQVSIDLLYIPDLILKL